MAPDDRVSQQMRRQYLQFPLPSSCKRQLGDLSIQTPYLTMWSEAANNSGGEKANPSKGYGVWTLKPDQLAATEARAPRPELQCGKSVAGAEVWGEP